jgi:hypothetical protein
MTSKKPKTGHKDSTEEKLPEQPVSTPQAEEVTEAPAVIPDEEIQELRLELDQALEKSNEYLNGWQREGLSSSTIKSVLSGSNHRVGRMHLAMPSAGTSILPMTWGEH